MRMCCFVGIELRLTEREYTFRRLGQGVWRYSLVFLLKRSTIKNNNEKDLKHLVITL